LKEVIEYDSNDQNLLEIIHEKLGKNIINALCAGTGTCGKCRIKIQQNRVEKLNSPTEIEKQFLGDRINQNIRLSCQVYPKEDLKISIIDLIEYKDNLFKIQPDNIFLLKASYLLFY